MSPTQKRKRSPRLTKEVRSAAILKAAREVFEEKGYEAATVSEIADRIGIVEGTVFHYFGSKRKLVFAVMESFYRQITEEVKEALKGIQGTHGRMRYIIWFQLKTVTENATLCSVILNESRGLDSEFTEDVKRFNRDYTDALKIVVQEGVECGDLRPGLSAELIRNMVYGSIEHILWELISYKRKVNIEESTEQITSMIYEGIVFRGNKTSKSDVSLLIKKLNHMLED